MLAAFSNLRIARKLAISFLLVVLAAGTAGAIIFAKLSASEHATLEVLRTERLILLTERLEKAANRQDGQFRGFLITANPAFLKPYEDGIREYEATHRETLAEITSADNIERLKLAESRLAKWREQWAEPLIERVRNGDRLGAQQAMAAAGQRIRILHVLEPLGEVRDSQTSKLAGRVEMQAETIDSSFVTLYVGGAFLIAFACFLGWMLSSLIARPLAAMTAVMGRLADGDTKVDIRGGERRDEVGDMARAVLVFRDNAVAVEKAAVEKTRADAEQKQVVDDVAHGLGKLAGGDLTAELKDFPGSYKKLEEDFNAAIAEVRAAMLSIAHSTGNIHGGSGEIAQASDDLSRRTEQQAASLEETAAAMTEVTATVQNSAVGANEANKLVLATQADAQASSKVVRAAVDAMSEIEKSSQQVTQIIGVIEKIAFQTNLLALNASVEAAHAGEAGQAFAVVANEVRALAQRSADAAQEIGQLISTSGEQVENGVKLVGEAGEALERIIGSVDEISGLVSQIAMAADQQSTALAQVNTAIGEMDKVTQQNAAMVEQSTAAARSLSDEATSLSRLVGRFSIGDDQPAAPAARPKPKAKRAAPRPAVSGNTALALQSNLATAVDDWNEF